MIVNCFRAGDELKRDKNCLFIMVSYKTEQHMNKYSHNE